LGAHLLNLDLDIVFVDNTALTGQTTTLWSSTSATAT
jgi:hypothetical protein